jgi:hypothetical protein
MNRVRLICIVICLSNFAFGQDLNDPVGVMGFTLWYDCMLSKQTHQVNLKDAWEKLKIHKEQKLLPANPIDLSGAIKYIPRYGQWTFPFSRDIYNQ